MGWPKGKPRNPLKQTATEVLKPTSDSLDAAPSKKEIPSAVAKAENNPREKMFEEITDRIEEQRENEIKSEDPTHESPVVEEPVEKVAEVPEGVTEPVEEDKEEVKEDKEPEYLTVKIDGEEIQVLKSEVEEAGGLRAYQKERAATKRLQEANDLLKELKKAKEDLLPSKDQPVADAKKLDPVELARTLQIGTPEEAAEAVRLLQSEHKMDPHQITRMVDERIEFQSSVQEFKTEFKDIFSDPYLMTIATTMENNARRNGDVRSYRDLYKEIGTSLRKWKDGLSRPATQEDKKAKKATVTNLPSASTRQAPAPEEKEETDADYINHLRKIRGQIT